MQSRVILFCYAYIVGIVLAKVLRVDPAYIPILNSMTGLAGLLFIGYLIRPFFSRKSTSASLAMVLLILPALFLGYSRYTSENTVEDTRLGVIQMREGLLSYVPEVSLPDTSRIRFRSLAALDDDLRIVVKGELDARVPVLSADGVPQIDEAGRWKFRLVRLEQESQVITLAKNDAPGTDYLVPQPFTRVKKIEILGGPSSANVALYRVSNHIASFIRPGRDSTPLTILGRITADPVVFDFKTVLSITPLYVQYRTDGPFYRVEGGEVRATLKPGMSGYDRFARSDAYGYDVVVHGSASSARPAPNPGGFDQREFLRNHNVYGSISLFEAPGGPAPIDIVSPPQGAPRSGIPLVEFSLNLRDRMLRVFKMTMPYPQSAFLGAVTLGLRYGLQSTVYPWRGFGFSRAGQDSAPNLITDEFRYAGVNHVLAVSGLHVTIITVMFMGIFSLMRISRRVYVPAIILILIVFAIITGARPSTLRAVIMNSLFLLTWAYLDQGLRSSALLGVPVAAFLILLQNPMMIVDASFTLSFGAILSLALLTDPFYEILSRLKGNSFLAFIMVVTIATGVGIYRWSLLVTPAFWIPFVLLSALLFAAARRLTDKGVRFFGHISYSDVPASAGAFVAAQFGIQIGMMLPLSAYYFSRWPFAGAYANLIAIPLIGVVVQLGVMAGLIGFIPVIGLPIALVLNASNAVFSAFFLWISHVCTEIFPYPFVSRPSITFLIVYYIWCAAFIWHKPLWSGVRQWCEVKGPRRLKGPKGATVIVVAAALLSLAPLAFTPSAQRDKDLKITVLSVGYGSSILIETPAGKNVLVDAGFVEEVRGRHNSALRTVLPFLSYRGIRHFDYLVLTSPRPERAAGISYILKHCRVDQCVLPPGSDQENKWIRAIHAVLDARNPSLMNRWARWDTESIQAEPGQVLFEEEIGGKKLKFEVVEIAPDSGSVVLRVVYGNFAILLPSDLDYSEVTAMTEGLDPGRIAADILIVPAHGAALPEHYRTDLKGSVARAMSTSFDPLLKAVSPEWSIFEFGNPRPALGHTSRDALKVFEHTAAFFSDRLGEGRCLNTDSDMAVFISSDGASYEVSTMAERYREAGVFADEVAVLEVGF
ncbi:MAG: ComEC/Rec2 family competence protein [Verrucomicrobia bacterium]|nr:ComEC/Rec2 family competence protein [Verrucomicrobiota bacterium]